MRVPDHLIGRLGRSVLAAMMALVWTGADRYATAADRPSTNPAPATTRPVPKELKGICDELDRSFKAVEGALRDLPRDSFDVQAVVQTEGRDPAALLQWVRDNTWWVPYRGVLRGETGVLMDRLGNSLDRSLLLYALLRAAGHEARLAHATLGDDAAADLVKQARPVPQEGASKPRKPSTQSIDDMVQHYAKQFQLTPGHMRAAIDRARLEEQKAAEQIAQRLAQQVPILTAAMGEAPARGATTRPSAIEDARDHWWVQLRQDSGWTDLDPTLADGKPGRALAVPQATTQPAHLSDLSDDLLHTVQIKLVVEYWEKGAVREMTVLTQKLLPAGLYGQTIALRHTPMDWPRDLDLASPGAAKRVKDAAAGGHEWLPILAVGSKTVQRYSFTDDALLNDTTLPTYGASAAAGRKLVQGAEQGGQKLGQGVGGILSGGRIGGSGLGRGPAQAPPQEEDSGGAELTAEWIDYEIQTPGRSSQIIRREIFDLLGPAQRAKQKIARPHIGDAQRLSRALALMGDTQILLLPASPSPDYVQRLALENLLANREFVLALLPALWSGDARPVLDKASEVKAFPAQLYSLALARRQSSRAAGRTYLDRINILSQHRWLQAEANGRYALWQAFDIVASDVGVTGGTGDERRVRLEQGVLDANAESIILAGSGVCHSAADLLEASSARGGKWLTVRDRRDPAWRAARVSADLRARVDQDLAAGFIVMVPDKPMVRDGVMDEGWWRIDPATGHVLAMGERGWGQVSTEMMVHIAGLVLTGVAGMACILIYSMELDAQIGHQNLTWYQQHLPQRNVIMCLGAVAITGGASALGGEMVSAWGLGGAIWALLSSGVSFIDHVWDPNAPAEGH